MSDTPSNGAPNPNTPAAPVKKKPETFPEYLRSAKFGEVIPAFMKSKEKDFVRLALNDIPKNPQLARVAQAYPVKVVSALMDCARLGLMPGPLGHVYLVPFGDEVQVIVGYKGLIDLARRSGEVARVEVDVIYAEDQFEYVKGDSPSFVHRPNLGSKKRGEADIVAAYAFAYDKKGVNLGGAVMPKADVDAIRMRSKTGGSKASPWHTDYAEMAKKTAIRRASKLWPVQTEFHEAVSMEDMHEDRIQTVVASSDRLGHKPALVDGGLYADGSPEDGQETVDGVTITPPPRSE